MTDYSKAILKMANQITDVGQFKSFINTFIIILQNDEELEKITLETPLS